MRPRGEEWGLGLRWDRGRVWGWVGGGEGEGGIGEGSGGGWLVGWQGDHARVNTERRPQRE